MLHVSGDFFFGIVHFCTTKAPIVIDDERQRLLVNQATVLIILKPFFRERGTPGAATTFPEDVGKSLVLIRIRP